jgi:CubicO group peptidase (beta-lactamase class C family)
MTGPPLVPLPPQPPGVPWPTEDWAPGAAVPAAFDAALDDLLDHEDRYGRTHALLVVHHGRLVAERYAGAVEHWGVEFGDPPVPVDAARPLLSWSMAKSILHAVVGLLVGDGRMALDDRPGIPAWETDARAQITLRHLLEMRDGLDFFEDYVDGRASDTINMLFGAGAADMAAYAADRPLAAAPGERFNYSSGTSNIISAMVAAVVGGGDDYERFVSSRLFLAIGARSPRLTMDGAGTWVASSYVHAVARDFARFGLLYLRDGVWDGDRILPAGWVDHGRTSRSVDVDGERYGAHWWVMDDKWGTFAALGYDGQSITVTPALDLVIVRLGRTDHDDYPQLGEWRGRAVAAFAG